MSVSNRDKILIAMYKLCNEDVVDVEKFVNAKNLKIEFKDFCLALERLCDDEMVKGITFAKGSKDYNLPFWDKGRITQKGIDYIENNIGIENTLDKKEKIKFLVKECIKGGWEEIKDIGTSYTAKLTAEVINK